MEYQVKREGSEPQWEEEDCIENRELVNLYVASKKVLLISEIIIIIINIDK